MEFHRAWHPYYTLIKKPFKRRRGIVKTLNRYKRGKAETTNGHSNTPVLPLANN